MPFLMKYKQNNNIIPVLLSNLLECYLIDLKLLIPNKAYSIFL